MKLKFCSDADCPLWVLAALHALSSLSLSVFKSLVQQVVEDQNDDDIFEILKDTSLSSREECARAAAVIRWVLQSAWRSSCAGAQLTPDLLLLGMPKAHATTLAEAVDTHRDAYVTRAESSGFMINKVIDASIEPGPEGTIASHKLTLVTTDVAGVERKRELLIEKTQAKVLLEELTKAQKKMEEFRELEES